MKHFVIVMGGAGVGKNHYIERHADRFSDHTLVDIDVFKKAGARSPMALMQGQLASCLASGVNVVHPTVGGTVLGNVNKLKLAKSFGYITEVIYLRGSAEQGRMNVQKRAQAGGHVVPDRKVDLTYARAEDAFREICDAADYWSIVHLK